MALAIRHLYEFGAFSLDIEERVLRRDGEIVPLTPRVSSMLLLLVETQGRILSKAEMMSALWPDAFVEESNRTFNIRKLRKALNDDAHECRYVETVPRRGYRFKAEVKEVLAERILDKMPEIRPASSSGNGSNANEQPEETMSVSVSVDARPAVPVSDESVARTEATHLASRRKKRNGLIATTPCC